jgi:DNA-binding CsgD family transcriptional regulator
MEFEAACRRAAATSDCSTDIRRSTGVSLISEADRALMPPTPTIAGAEQLISAAEWEYLARSFRLTPSQTRIASLLCAGYSQAAMAQRAQLSINTVRAHLRALFGRLEAHDRVGVLVRLLSARRRFAARRSAAVACEV